MIRMVAITRLPLSLDLPFVRHVRHPIQPSLILLLIVTVDTHHRHIRRKTDHYILRQRVPHILATFLQTHAYGDLPPVRLP
jgi:hypothetical protein